MNEREGTRGLASTGNRLLLAVVVGLLVSFVSSLAGLHGTARVVVFALVAALTYALVTVLRQPRR